METRNLSCFLFNGERASFMPASISKTGFKTGGTKSEMVNHTQHQPTNQPTNQPANQPAQPSKQKCQLVMFAHLIKSRIFYFYHLVGEMS